MKKVVILMFSTLLSILFVGCNSDDTLNPGRPLISSSDSIALRNVYDSLLSYRYIWADSWLWARPYGVSWETNTVDNTRKIVGIIYEDSYIHENSGVPQIPNSLFELKDLRRIEFKGFSNLKGSISKINTLPKLDTLILHNLSFSSPFPEELTQCTNLKYLEIVNCRFHGPLPASIGNLRNLETLKIEQTDMEGELPESIGNLTELKELKLYSKNFYGNIPKSLKNLTKAEKITLVGNHLSGSFPIEVLHSNCKFYCHNNDIESLDFSVWSDETDIIPPYIMYNKLTGTIPDWVFSTQKWKKYCDYVNNQQIGYGYTNFRYN